MKILVCGSRSWTEEWHGTRIHMMLTAYHSDDALEIMHGGAQGADQWAGEWARENHVPCRVYPADWELYGRRAGLLRNLEMLDEKPDLVLAFWDGKSRGTEHTIATARERGIPVEVIYPESRLTSSGRGRP